jgi:hypothetical protein
MHAEQRRTFLTSAGVLPVMYLGCRFIGSARNLNFSRRAMAGGVSDPFT